jgi:hypothetical protein
MSIDKQELMREEIEKRLADENLSKEELETDMGEYLKTQVKIHNDTVENISELEDNEAMREINKRVLKESKIISRNDIQMPEFMARNIRKNQAASMYGIAHDNSFVADSIPGGDIVNDAGNVIPFMNRKQRRELEKRLRKMNKKPKR